MTHASRATKPPGIRRAVLASAAVLAVAGTAGAAPVAAQSVPAEQELAVLMRGHVARTAPDPGAQKVATVRSRRPLSRVRTSMPVVGHAAAADGTPWLQVILPGRPKQKLGWIAAAETRPKTTAWRVIVDRSSRKVTVYNYGSVAKRFSAIVGKKSTPTPVGDFFIEEAVAISGGSTGGPYGLATSARSAVFQEFEGGPGQIAIHGMGNLSGTMGTAASHGCIRLNYKSISWLAHHVGSGVPLTIKD